LVAVTHWKVKLNKRTCGMMVSPLASFRHNQEISNQSVVIGWVSNGVLCRPYSANAAYGVNARNTASRGHHLY
jgi:hypothetical protein